MRGAFYHWVERKIHLAIIQQACRSSLQAAMWMRDSRQGFICNRSLPQPSWERGHLGRIFGGRDARAPRGE
jgi:hypothetical protein